MSSISTSKNLGACLAAVADRLRMDAAIVENGNRITFGELDARSTSIARQIVAAGGGRTGIVCLLLESRLRVIEAIFGACRSGSPYVVLNALDPDERLRFVLRDSEAVALLTERALEHRARALAPDGCVVVDTGSPGHVGSALDRDEGPALPTVSGNAAACIYYTSGSTGEPKGVVQTHGNLLFFAEAYGKALGIGTGDRLSLLNSLAFAAANLQVFRGLLNGATLCVYDLRNDGIPQLADWLDRERITVMHTVPSAFREMASRLPADRLLPHLRAIHLGGESVYAGDVALFRKHTLEHCMLVNQFASSEAGVIAQNLVTHASPPTADTVVPVGQCIEGTQVEIRRGDGSMADVDEVGEVTVCGAHLSPGYWRRPELDAAAFSAHPRCADARCYRSGDLGRIDAAGNLHFLGRKGSRIKIRGHSIDLSEIEATLAACPGVTHWAVAAVGDEAKMEHVRLIAWVSMPEGAERDPARIRQWLASRLPSYMLPSRIVVLDALPLTPTGKVNRAALSALDPKHAGSDSASQERRTEPAQDDVERTVTRVFADVLKCEAVGRNDEFFLIGGDSLSAVELQLRLREAFGVHVGMFHDGATVAGVASDIRRSIAEQVPRSQPIPVLVPLWRNGSETPLFIVHGRHGQAFVGPHFMQLLGNEQPVFAFQAPGLDGLREPHTSVEAMAREYLDLLRAERPHGPYFLASLCAGVYIVTIMARALHDAGEEVLPLLLLDPPNSTRQGGYRQITEERFVAKMRERRAKGITAGPMDDPGYVKALVRTAMAFEHAIADHRPLPYDGPAYVLSSRQRIGDAGAGALRQFFTGRFERFEVGSTHAEALNPRNPVFANALLRCVGSIREAAHSTANQPVPSDA